MGSLALQLLLQSSRKINNMAIDNKTISFIWIQKASLTAPRYHDSPPPTSSKINVDSIDL